MLTYTGGDGDRGSDGAPGEKGAKGSQGESGYNGVAGKPGQPGSPGKHGHDGRGRSEIIAIHSYSRNVPRCPENSHRLWKGYSLGGQALNDRSSTGTCLQRFSTLSRERMSAGYYYSLKWMFAGRSFEDNMLQEGENFEPKKAEKFVSRCSVCEVQGNILTLHSQTTMVPECPDTWHSMWSGYSYLNLVSAAQTH